MIPQWIEFTPEEEAALDEYFDELATKGEERKARRAKAARERRARLRAERQQQQQQAQRSGSS